MYACRRVAFALLSLLVVGVGCSKRDAQPARPATALVTRKSASALTAAPGSALAPGQFHLQDAATGVTVDVALRGVQEVTGDPQADGTVIYRGAYGGADVVERTTPDGVEDSIAFANPPSVGQVDYDLALGNGVAGLRLVDNVLEFVDAMGMPRLRVARPSLVGADGVTSEPTYSVEGCAIDQDARVPWNHAPVEAGARACVLHLSWSDLPVVYPAVLDPSWTTTTDMPTARRGGAFVLLADGTVLAAGGINGNNSKKAVEVYNPATNVWSQVNALRDERSFATATLLPGGRVLVTGGLNRTMAASLATAEVFDGLQWSTLQSSMVVARSKHAAVAVHPSESTTKILVAGGTADRRCDLFDPVTNTFSTTASLNSARTEFTLTALNDGRVLAVGGTSAPAAAEIYGPAAPASWSNTGGVRALRSGHVAALLRDGSVLVAGGHDLSAEIYIPSTTSWSVQPPMAAPRYLATATALKNGQVLVAGGSPAGGSSGVFATTTLFAAGSPGTWIEGPSMVTARYQHGAVLLNDGRVLVAGGANGSNDSATAKAEVFSGTKGLTCLADPDCDSGFCTDGVCCDARCSDQPCGACNLAGKEGTCSATNSPPSDRTGCASDGTVCGGACNGIALGCTYADTNTSCRVQSCSSGTQTSAAKCDGAGHCPSAVTVACAPFVCTASPGTACLTACVTKADCDPAVANYCTPGGGCVMDLVPPVLTLPEAISAEATSGAGAAVSFSATAHDIIAGEVPVSCSPAAGSTFCLGATTINCSATDPAGNGVTGSFTVTVVDTTAPSITGAPPSPIVAEATGPAGASVSWLPLGATDTVDGPVSVNCAPPSESIFGVGEHVVTCSATDAHTNFASVNFTVAVVDTTAPALTLPASVTSEATGGAGAKVEYTSSALDLVDGPVAVTCTPASGTTFALGETTVNCSSTDAHGNTGTGSFVVTVTDTTPPALSLPADMTPEATKPEGAEVTFKATAADIVDGAAPVVCTRPDGQQTETLAKDENDLFSSAKPYKVDDQVTITCTSTDAHHNMSTGHFMISVQDKTAPALNVTQPGVTEATGPAGAAVSFIATASDLVDGVVTPSCNPASGSTFGLGQTAVTCTATDAHGNTATAGITVKVVDTTPPVLALPADVTKEATGPTGAAVSYVASANDIVSGNVTVTCSKASGETFALGETTVTCSARDAANNVASGSFKVTVVDMTPPALTVPGDKTVEATGPSGADVTYSATATDLVDGPVAPVCAPASGATFALGTTSVTCTATDAHHNVASQSLKVTVVDTTAPIIGSMSNIVKEATGPAGAPVTYTPPNAVDAVSGTFLATCAPGSGVFPLGITTVTCTAKDAAGNAATPISFSVSVVDTTPPVVTVPADMTAEATSAAGAAVTYAPTAVDIVDGDVSNSIACIPASGSMFAVDVPTLVTCSVTDAHHNTGTASFTVTVRDRTAPELTVPANITKEATGPSGTAVTFAAIASDVVDGAVVPVCAPASGSTFPVGETTVHCSASDLHHNMSEGSFKVIVVDTTPPVVTVPAPITAEATGPSGAVVTFTSSASDLVDGTLASTCTSASGSTFAIGTTTVTCSATDAHRNTGTASFTVTVRDTTAPVVTVPALITAEATGPSGAAVTFASSASDIVDGAIVPTCVPVSGSTFPLGATTVTCTATDAHHNTGSKMLTITVRDTTPPSVTVPSPIKREATGAAGASVTFTVSATDLVDGVVSASCAPASGSTFALGSTTVNCSATDEHGNSGTGSFTVTVVDTTPPVVNVPRDIALTGTSAAGAPATYLATATDLVDSSVPVTCNPASGTVFPAGTTTVTCSATDAHGNKGTASFQVNVTFAWSQYLQPINLDGSSVWKLGRTVPVKFQLTGASAGITNLVAHIYVAQVSSGVIGSFEEVSSTSAADTGNQYRYDATGGQYIYNLATGSSAAVNAKGTWIIRTYLGGGNYGDGVAHDVYVSVKP